MSSLRREGQIPKTPKESASGCCIMAMDDPTFLHELQHYDRRLREQEEQIARLQDRLQGLQNELIHDPETRLHSPAYFQVRLQEEIMRAERYRHFLSLIMIHVNLRHSASTHQISQEIRQIGTELAAGLTRRTDLVALYRKRQMVVMLPETEAHGCHTLLLRYQAMFPNNGRRLNYAVLCYPNDATNLEMVLTRLNEMSEDLFRGTQPAPHTSFGQSL